MNSAFKLRLFEPDTEHGAVANVHPSAASCSSSLATAPANQLGRSEVGSLNPGSAGVDSAVTISDVWRRRMCGSLKARGRTAATLREYETAVSLWQSFWESAPEIQGEVKRGSVVGTEPQFYPNQQSEPPIYLISSVQFEAFQTWLSASIEPITINKRIADLLKIVRHAAKLGLCRGVPEVDLLQARKGGEKIKLPLEHVDAIYEACGVAEWPTIAKHKGQSYQLPFQPANYWRWLIVWLFNYGARVQDFVAYESSKRPLTWSSISTDQESPRTYAKSEWGWFHFVPTKTRWTKDVPLVLAMNETTALHLRAIRPGRLSGDDRLMPITFDKRRFRATWKAIAQAARVKPKRLQDPNGHGYQLKHFRDTCASFHNDNLPGAASMILGHTTPTEGKAVTAAHYDDFEERIVKAMQLEQPASFKAIRDRSQKYLPFLNDCDP